MSAGLRVLDPGFLTTVQDLGRPGHGEAGVPVGGAADPVALRVGNRLVGNEEGAPALEMTLRGPRLACVGTLVIAVAGSGFEVALGGLRLPPWTPVETRPGDVVECGGTRTGARGYLCVRGGVDVPLVLGSASTHVLVGFGGVEGRGVRPGDFLSAGTRAVEAPRGRPLDTPLLDRLFRRGALRVTWGPESESFPEEARSALQSREWRVSETSDRMGVRLAGEPLPAYGGLEMITQGVSWGTVQVPPDGLPIVLGVEHPTTGGYPRIASVISADLHLTGSLRPRDSLRFEAIPFSRAVTLLREREETIDALLR